MADQPQKLYRSSTDRVFAGVCGGLGEYFNLDPLVFRALFIIITFAGGSGLLIYLILILIIPNRPAAGSETVLDGGERIKNFASEIRDDAKNFAQQVRTGQAKSDSRTIVGLVIVAIGILLLLNQILPVHWLRWDIFWPAIVIIIGVLILVRRR